MDHSKSNKAAIIHKVARYSLLIISVIVVLFSLVSGSEDYGGGLQGVIKNSPNSLPWISLVILVIIAWKWELIGGVLVTIFGFFLLYFFNFAGPNFFISTFILTSIIPTLGLMLVVSWALKHR